MQAALLALTLVVMVDREAPPKLEEFSGAITGSGEVREQAQQKQRSRELQQRLSRPRSFQRLAVESSFDSALPPAPALPRDAFDQSSMEAVFAEDSQALLGAGALSDLRDGLSGRESATEFFGVKASGRRIVIVVNTSASVVRKAARRGVTIERIQEEAARVIEGLESGTSFGIVQFSQGARVFSEQLAPALKKNKAAAAAWVRAELKGNPKIESEAYLGHEAAFHEALQLRPDLIFLVTDGSLNRRVRSGSGYAYPTISYEQLINAVEREMRDNGSNPRIHAVGFELEEETRTGLRRLTQRFGGSLREF